MIITLDFETLYTQEYSLRKMSEVEYVLHPMFETIMVAIKRGREPVEVFTGDAVTPALSSIDWSNVALLSHNTRFDAAILYWRYGHMPKFMLDTLSMARAMTHARAKSSSLAAVAKYLGLPAKGDAVVRAQGKNLASFTHDELEEYKAYCAHDTELCRTIYDLFVEHGFPKSELRTIDLNLRKFLCPQVKLNSFVLAEHLAQVQSEKEALLARVAHIDPSVFSSNQKFAALLESEGVEVPTKISPTTQLKTFALARNDRAFRELCNDPDQPAIVQALLAARTGVKSTIEETRTASLLRLSQRSWPGGDSGWMPVPYRYFGAHTGRFSGDGGYNFANLKRGSRIREAIRAPEGHRIVHRDSSQIECRMLARLAGCEKLLGGFREGRDIYSEFASRFYARKITKADPKERFVGKTSVLSLGYGAGWQKFRLALFIGNGGISVDLTDIQADKLVRFYRDEYPEIPVFWQLASGVIYYIADAPKGKISEVAMPPLTLDTETLWLPNNTCIQYPNLRRVQDESGAIGSVYDGPLGPKKLYGAKMVENICQALARIVLTDVEARVYALTGWYPFMSTYDSHDYCVPVESAAGLDELLAYEFAQTPVWLPGLPLASEGGWGVSLADAEKGINQ